MFQTLTYRLLFLTNTAFSALLISVVKILLIKIFSEEKISVQWRCITQPAWKKSKVRVTTTSNFVLFICIYVLEPCNDIEEGCPMKAAKGDCWKTAKPSSIMDNACDPDRTFPLWVTCKKSCRRCNGKGWKTKRVQQTNICRYSYACYKHDDNICFQDS